MSKERFTPDDIRAAINDPNFVMGPDLPFYRPVMRELVTVGVAGQFAYCLVSPGAKAVLEINRVIVSLAGAINLRLMTRGQFNGMTPTAAVADSGLYRMQELSIPPLPDGQSYSTVVRGSSLTVDGQSVGRYSQLGDFPLQYPFVMFGDDASRSPLFGATAQVVNTSIGITIIGREWPYSIND